MAAPPSSAHASSYAPKPSAPSASAASASTSAATTTTTSRPANLSGDSPTIRTRILIISDTHGIHPLTHVPAASETTASPCTLHGHDGVARSPFHHPLPEADVVIHCGDLTKRSTLEEYRATAEVLRSVRAPVRIAIAGNHDLSLHGAFMRDKLGSVNREQPTFGGMFRQVASHSDAKTAITGGNGAGGAASAEGPITYLEEGTKDIVLPNGARLRLYTSPWTPSYGGWAFQYEGGHTFDIPAGVDLAVTHGPPYGVLDYAASGDYAGCRQLFSAVQKARPRVHCYGHIHEGWGAYHGHWTDRPWETSPSQEDTLAGLPTVNTSRPPDTAGSFDMTHSRRLETVETIRLTAIDSEEAKEEKRQRYTRYSVQGCRTVDVTPGGDAPVERGMQTLFLNAAILDRRYKIAQFPWMLEIDLPKADSTATGTTENSTTTSGSEAEENHVIRGRARSIRDKGMAKVPLLFKGRRKQKLNA